MEVLLYVGIGIGFFFLMEGAAWFTHKYIMHGLLWTWHRSHHSVRRGIFERNDLFAVVFSVPAISLIVLGFEWPFYPLAAAGFGITGYGVFYFLFHDVLVHRRIPIKFKAKHPYLKRIMRAHYLHHQQHTKEGCQAFGFLYAPPKYDQRGQSRRKQAS